MARFLHTLSPLAILVLLACGALVACGGNAGRSPTARPTPTSSSTEIRWPGKPTTSVSAAATETVAATSGVSAGATETVAATSGSGGTATLPNRFTALISWNAGYVGTSHDDEGHAVDARIEDNGKITATFERSGNLWQNTGGTTSMKMDERYTFHSDDGSTQAHPIWGNVTTNLPAHQCQIRPSGDGKSYAIQCSRLQMDGFQEIQFCEETCDPAIPSTQSSPDLVVQGEFSSKAGGTFAGEESLPYPAGDYQANFPAEMLVDWGLTPA